MKQYEMLWVPVDGESSPKSTRLETECGTLDAIENSIVLTLEELKDIFVAGMARHAWVSDTMENKMYSEPPTLDRYLTSKGIKL